MEWLDDKTYYAVVFKVGGRYYYRIQSEKIPDYSGEIEEVFSGKFADVSEKASVLEEKLNKPLREAEKAMRGKEKRRMVKINRCPHRLSKKDAIELARFIGLF